MNKSHKHIFIILIILLLMVGITSTVSAANHEWTPQEFLDNISKIQDGDNITISSGTQNVSAVYKMNNTNITITAKGTVIFNGNATQSSFKITGNNVTIKGITFTNLNESKGGGLQWEGNHGNVINCTFINNSAYDGCAIYWEGSYGNVTKCTFINNNATVDGGAIFWYANNGTIQNCNFSNNGASQGNAVSVLGDNNIASNCNFNNNSDGISVGGHGGAFFVGGDFCRVSNCNFTYNRGIRSGISWKGLNGTVSNCKFSNNTAYSNQYVLSGVIWWSSTNGAVCNCTFINNTINSAEGSVIHLCDEGYYNVTGCKFINNKAINGGAIYFSNSNYGIIEYCEFYNNKANTANGYGGAICFIQVDYCSVNYCKFANNTANAGSTIYIENSTYNTIKCCEFYNNKANGTDEYDGGAIYFYGSDYCNVDYCNFTNNSQIGSSTMGGAIYWSGINGTVEHCSFINNTANSGASLYWIGANGKVINCNFTNSTALKGGAIYWQGANGIVENCNFIDNNASYGGVIYWYYSNYGNVVNCKFSNNTASYYGGSIYWDNAINGTVERCNFTNGNVNTHGGAIYWINSVNGTLKECIFDNNNAGSGGAIFWLYSDYGNISGCNFTDNNASYGGSICVYDSKYCLISDCNFTRNTATYNGGAIYWCGSINGTIKNCNFINNIADIGSSIVLINTNTLRTENTTLINNKFSESLSSGTSKANVVNNNTRNIGITGGENALILFVGENATINSKVNVTILDNKTRTVKKGQKTNLTAVITADGINNILIGLPLNFTVEGSEITGSVNNTNYIAEYTPNTPGLLTVSGSCDNTNKALTGYLNGTLNVLDIPSLTIDVNSTEYGKDAIVIVNVTGADGKIPTGNITLYINETFYKNQTIDNTGKAQFIISNLAASKYTIKAIYNGDATYASVTNNTNFNVNPATPKINITTSDITYGENATIKINVTGITGKTPTGNITLYINNEFIKNETLKSGNAEFTIPNLGANTYNINITFNAYGNYTKTSNTTSIKVNPTTPKVNITTSDITYGENATIKVNVTGVAGRIPVGNVTLYINNEFIKNETLDNGKVLFVVPDLNAGVHEIKAVYVSNNANYTNSFNSTSINVTKANPTFNISNITYGDGEIIISTNSTVNGNVTITIDDMNKTIPIVNGTADLNITEWGLPAGNYTAQINFTGNDNYTSIIEEINFTIEKGNATFNIDNVTYSDGKIVISTNTTINGNITVTINDETKIVPIVNGTADLNITEWGLSAGNYTALLNFTGNDNYTSIIEEINFTIEKGNATFNIDNITYGDDELIINTNGGSEEGNITVTIDGITKVIPIINGTANLNITEWNLPAGNYSATIKYLGDKNYNSTITVINFTSVGQNYFF